MYRPGVIILIIAITMFLIICGLAEAQNFVTSQLADKIFTIENTDDGEKQVVIVSDDGLIVLNSFWSEITALRFKSEIAKALGRDDFIYMVDLKDRLDLFGGNAAYKEIPIVGHKAFWDKYKGKDLEVGEEVSRLIRMWRQKEVIARERMANHKPGSEQAAAEQQWINTCKIRADELESGFSLVLPTEIYKDRKDIKLSDITINLIWLGKAGYEGISVIKLPELKLAIIPELHPQHLAPYPRSEFSRLDVPRWIDILEELLEGDNAVDKVLCGMYLTDVWSRERAHTHLSFIRKLWNAVGKAESAGKDLPEIQDELSLDNEFSFVKDMQPYKDHGDDWIRPQHQMHVRQFFLQHKNPASEIIYNLGYDSLDVALRSIRKLRDDGKDIYFEESTLNRIGYDLLNMERYADAIEVFKLNVDVFPESANVYDSYAEALMKNGDKENAVLNYNKSLELNPDNENAKEMIKTLLGK